MTTFHYENKELYIEDVPVEKIAEEVGTPFYCYSETKIREQYGHFAAAVSDLRATICFAVKANANIAVLKTLAAMGAGADIVSGGELLLARMAGIPANKIVFSGVGKTEDELMLAVREGIKQVNIESEAEAVMLNEIASIEGKRVNVALRVNPDVDARTHEKMTTGKKENKFGIEWNDVIPLYKMICRLKGLHVSGIDVHIGAQMTALEPMREAFQKLADMIHELNRIGLEIRTIDVGGGLGIAYRESDTPPGVTEYIDVLKETLGTFNCEFIFEPGRYLVAEAGFLITKVLYLKKAQEKMFAVVDAGMNDLIRPALYDAWHDIIPVTEPGTVRRRAYTVVGPICESSDVFAKNRPLHFLREGSLVALRDAGAYGTTMSSNYNMRPLVPEVLVKGNRYAVVRQRQSFEDLIALQSPAPWQE
ncbi:MAG: diaminopimelate decarboxylase [Alphaproteobacteria bacterium]